MLGMSNAAFFGLSLTVVSAAAITIAGVTGTLDPLIDQFRAGVEDKAPVALLPDSSGKANAPEGKAAGMQDATPVADTKTELSKAAEASDVAAEAIVPTKKPTVDIVRVEPSGDAVIAGQSDAGALVAVVSNGQVVGKGIANDTGDWVIVIEDPLKPGAHDIAVEAQRTESSEKVQAEEVIAVHIPKDESEGVLVATNKPGAATEILQVPNGPDTLVADLMENDANQPVADNPAEPETAAAEPAPESSAESEDPSTIIAARPQAKPESGSVARQPDAAAPQADGIAPQPDAAAPQADGIAPQPDDGGPIVVASAEPTPEPEPIGKAAPPSGMTAQESAPRAAPDDTASEPVDMAENPVAVAEPEPKATPPPPTGAPQTSKTPDAPKEPVQMAAVEPEVEPDPAPAELTRSNPAPAAPETGSKPEPVVEPAMQKPEIASSGPAAKDEPAAPARSQVKAGDPATEQMPPAAAAAEPEDQSSISVKAVEADQGQVYVAGESTGSEPVRVYIEDKFVGQAQPNAKGQWLLQAPKELDVGEHNVRADMVTDDKGTVSARAEVVFERDADEVSLVQVVAVGRGASGVAAGADVDAGRRQIPAMIIRKGDNLWRISRRHYGHGIRYTTIYQANQGQIRDPNMIFPGQVFLLPQRDLNWAAN